MKILNFLKHWLKKHGASENIIDYLCGSEALPLPLSGEEEAQMLEKLETGENVEYVKAQLIEHNLRLVVYISHKFENTGVESDDLISIGTIGLIKAINSFRTDKNIKLATYASRCIENEILMYLRRTVKLKSEVSFDEPLNTDFEGKRTSLVRRLGDGQRRRLRRRREQCREGTLERGLGKTSRAGEKDHVPALRARRRRRNDAKGRRRRPRNLPELYFAARKKDHRTAEKGNFQIGINYIFRMK